MGLSDFRFRPKLLEWKSSRPLTARALSLSAPFPPSRLAPPIFVCKERTFKLVEKMAATEATTSYSKKQDLLWSGGWLFPGTLLIIAGSVAGGLANSDPVTGSSVSLIFSVI